MRPLPWRRTHHSRGRLSAAQLVGRSRVPERFRSVHRLYLETYAERISDVYATTRHKDNSLERLWEFLDERYPEVGSSAQVRREHLLAFIPHAIERARARSGAASAPGRRGPPDTAPVARQRALLLRRHLHLVNRAGLAQVKAFYGTDHVPACDHWDAREKRADPRAPYLLQGVRHPSPIAFAAIRSRLARLSRRAEATRSDGTQLTLRPHDCRRLFASEHLNHNTPPHVIQALLGHASIDTVMIYGKLYPSTLVEEYRKTVSATYAGFHGAEGLRAPTVDEWEELSRSCNMRDMGTHLCALPAGDHCARGLICLGCSHAQPKRRASPVFRRMS